jgi:hypothetical protein
MLNTDLMQARDLSTGDEVSEGIITDINTGPTGLLMVEVAAYHGSAITNTITLSPVDYVKVI